MAHTHTSSARIPSSGTSTSNPVSASFTCADGVTVLVLAIMYAGVTARTGGAPTYGGKALTQADSRRGVTECSVEVWYLINPPLGSNTLSIPNANTRTLMAVVASASAANGYTSMYDIAGGRAATNTNPYASATATAAAYFFAGVADGGDTFAPTARTGTSLLEEDLGTWGVGVQYYLKAASGAQTMQWTFATSDDYGAVTVAFKEVAVLEVNESESVTTGEANSSEDNFDLAKEENVTTTDFPGYYSDEVAVRENITLLISSEPVLSANKSDGTTVSEVISRAVDNPGVNKADGATVGEVSAAALASSVVSKTETVTTGESVSLAVSNLAASKVDTVAASETLSLSLANLATSPSDAVTAGETRSVILADLVASKAESATTGESVSGTIDNPGVSKLESATVSESASSALGVCETSHLDSVSAGESFSVAISSHLVSVVDEVAAGEAEQQVVSDLLVSDIESVTVGEVHQEVRSDLIVNVNDGAASSEQVALLPNALAIESSDSITTSELSNAAISVVPDHNTSISDSVTTSESVSLSLLSSAISDLENVISGEVVSASLSTALVSVADGATVGEQIAAISFTTASATDGVTSSEQVALLLSGPVASEIENVTTSEAASIQLGAEAVSKIEGVMVSEQVSVDIPLMPALLISATDSVTSNESNALAIPIVVGIVEPVVSSDSPATSINALQISKIDNAAASEDESVSIAIPGVALVSSTDPATVSEQVSVSLTDLSVRATDSAATGEICASFENNHSLNVIDSATINEAIIIALLTGGQPMIARVTTVPFMGRGRKGLV